MLLASLPAAATQVRIFRTQGQTGFLAGTLDGVSVDSLGRVALAPRVAKTAAIEEPFLFSAAALPDGWAVGTGNSGKVLKVDRAGKVSELFAAPEPMVFALWADPDGTVFAGTSPKGKVYRIPASAGGTVAKAEVYFDPQQTYIWALARATDGALLVGTGSEGKLFRVESEGKGSVLFDSDDTHIRSLEPLPGGDVLLGTAGEGLVVRVGRDGKARTLFDATGPEVVSLALGPDGTAYAAVVASEASLVDQARDQVAPAPPAPAAPGGKPGTPSVSVTVDTGEPPPARGRRGGGSGGGGGTEPRSEIFALSPDGAAQSLWSFAEETIYDLLWSNGRLWIATGVEGKVYSFADGKLQLEKDVDDRQVVALLPGTPGPSFATTNAAALYRVTAETESAGIYTSAAFDAGQISRFGTLSWRAEVPEKGALRFSFRSGFAAEPDKTWTPWGLWLGGDGNEIALRDLAPGRYVQWRAELKAGAARSPRLFGADLSYRQENQAPKIVSFTALDPGQILVPANFNPTNQVYEAAHPNREGIFTVLTPAGDDEGSGRTKPLWKLGFQSLRWNASDSNADTLVYDVSFRPVGADGGDLGSWLTVAEDLKDDYLSFDATALPDGVYRFRLRASDRLANDPDRAQVTERLSEPVVIDHTPPVLDRVERVDRVEQGKDVRLRAAVHDAANPLREAVYSIDAKEWKPAPAADGLLDGRAETLLLDVPAKAGLILLRVTDAAHNVTTFDLSARAR
jgi:hypothetical protein